MFRSSTSTSGLCAEDGAQRAVDVAGLRDHLEAVLGVEQQPQAAADHGVVVGEDDADGHAAEPTRRTVSSALSRAARRATPDGAGALGT